MSPHLAQTLVDAHARELTRRAEEARLARAARGRRRIPGPARSRLAGLIVALAGRLDDRSRPCPDVEVARA